MSHPLALDVERGHTPRRMRAIRWLVALEGNNRWGWKLFRLSAAFMDDNAFCGLLTSGKISPSENDPLFHSRASIVTLNPSKMLQDSFCHHLDPRVSNPKAAKLSLAYNGAAVLSESSRPRTHAQEPAILCPGI